MRRSIRIGRLGMLAVGLGIGAVVASTAGVASADPVSPLDPNVAAAPVDGVTGTLGAAAADRAMGPDIAISFSGIPLWESGAAHATSDFGDFAIAIGPGASATGGTGALSGIGNFAFADGTNSGASTGFGNFDFATALGNSTTAVSGDGGIFDFATVIGTDSDASAAAGILDTATTVGNHDSTSAGGESNLGFGNFDSAITFGNESQAFAVAGSGDLATIVNTGSSPDSAVAGGFFGVGAAQMGSGDIASVVGTDSTAFAGSSPTTAGNFDLAAVFSDMLHAVATGGNFLTDIAP